jgi:Flp pilus assembly pilin Flp
MRLGTVGPWVSVVEMVIPQDPGHSPHYRENQMHKLIFKPKIWTDYCGQDLIEYALMAGFVAVAAGAIMPNVAASISQIFSQVTSVLSNANNGS